MTNGWFAYRYLNDIATAYRQRGYETIVNPLVSQLPVVNARNVPDILVFGNGVYIAVQVKFLSASAVRNDSQIPESLASEVRQSWPPGSTTDLVWSPFPSVLPRMNVFRERLVKAAEIGDNYKEAAFLLGFSSLEGILISHSTLGRLPSQPTALAAAHVLRDDGSLSPNDFDAIYKLGSLRNRLAHGILTENSIESDDLDELLNIGNALLNYHSSAVLDVIEEFVSMFVPSYGRNTGNSEEYFEDEIRFAIARTSTEPDSVIEDAARQLSGVSASWVRAER